MSDEPAPDDRSRLVCTYCGEVLVYRRGDPIMHVGCAIAVDEAEEARIEALVTYRRSAPREDLDVERLVAEAALASAERDLLWALGALARLGWPASIADLFERHGQPGLVAEYQQVQANIVARACSMKR